MQVILSTVIMLFILAIIFLGLSFINKSFIRFIQVAIFLILGFFGAGQGEAGTLVGPSFISLAIIYAFQYGFLQKRLYLKTILFVAIYAAFVVYMTVLVQGSTIYNAFMTLIISLDLFYLTWIAFTPMLRESEKEMGRLRSELAENRVFVKLGRNTMGTVHNIRSKLATVRTYGQMMKGAEKEDTSLYLAKQETAISDIMGMLENLLANVRAYGESELKPCNLKDFILISLEFKKGDLDFKHGVKISTNLSQESAILGNPKDLVTIIECLLDNAQEAMTDREERLITLSAVEERHTIKLTIEDNGPGLRFCASCRHNFECLNCPEFHIGRSSKEKGSGIGMTLVRESVKRLNGEMRIESDPERGTAVHVWFPRYKAREIPKDMAVTG